MKKLTIFNVFFTAAIAVMLSAGWNNSANANTSTGYNYLPDVTNCSRYIISVFSSYDEFDFELAVGHSELVFEGNIPDGYQIGVGTRLYKCPHEMHWNDECKVCDWPIYCWNYQEH